jgi:hypothetical protein
VKAIVDKAEKDGKVSPSTREKTVRHGEKFGLDSLKSLVDSLPAKFKTVHTETKAKSIDGADDLEISDDAREFARRNNINVERVLKRSK